MEITGFLQSHKQLGTVSNKIWFNICIVLILNKENPVQFCSLCIGVAIHPVGRGARRFLKLCLGKCH